MAVLKEMMIILLIITSANKFCNIRLDTLHQGPEIMFDFLLFFNYLLARWHWDSIICGLFFLN